MLVDRPERVILDEPATGSRGRRCVMAAASSGSLFVLLPLGYASASALTGKLVLERRDLA